MSSERNTNTSKITLHLVSSLDGFIARKDNSVSWLEDNGSIYEPGVSISEEEATAFVKTIDCYVLGSRTYEHALELGWPYGDTPTVVVTAGLGHRRRRASSFIPAISKRWLMQNLLRDFETSGWWVERCYASVFSRSGWLMKSSWSSPPSCWAMDYDYSILP